MSLPVALTIIGAAVASLSLLLLALAYGVSRRNIVPQDVQ